MGYSKFALAFFCGGGVRGGNKLDVAWVMWGVGAHTMWSIFIFPSLMTKSDKKTPSGWGAWSAWMAAGLSILGAHPGSSSQWAMLGRLLCVGLELRFCSLRL